MKKSEVIKNIHWFLNDQLTAGEDGNGDIDYECSEDLLEYLEEMGMLPPLVFLDHFDKFDHVWESEDPVEAPNLASKAVEEYNVDQLSEEEAEELLTACKNAIKNHQDKRKGKK